MQISIIRDLEQQVIDDDQVLPGDLVLDNYGVYRPVQEFPSLTWQVAAPQPTLVEGLVGFAIGASVTLGVLAILKGVINEFAPSYNDAPLSQSTRNYIRERDQEVCYYCDVYDPDGHVDHMTSRANGGGNEDQNLTWACSPCNLTKGRLNADEFLAAYEWVS